MSDKPVKGTKKLTTANTPTNAASFLIEQAINAKVSTAEVVSIDGADQAGTDGPAGYAAATPLVCPVDGFNEALPPTSIPKMPFFRPQAGKAAIVMDPQPGDKAILVAMKRDSSGVASGKGDPVQPGSFRTFDQADGYLINGFLGEAPEIWLHLNPVSGDISLSTKAAHVEISCRESGDIEIKTAAGSIVITATDTVTVKAPGIILDGDVRITGNLTVEGKSHGRGGGPAVFSNGIVNESGGFANTGGINNTGGATTSNNVTVETHTHTGVQPGGGDTGSPNEGT
jgi:phage baseplate assembly protein gpV